MRDSKGFRAANAAMIVVFAISAALQYNDPDPWRWATIYLGAALAGVVQYGTVRRRWLLPAVVGLAASVWAAMLAPSTLPGFRVADLARTMKAGTPQIELSRELLGLLIVAVWMAVLVAVSTRARGPERR